ncbi:hypothetical protein KDL45_11895 [bacterium]|nr:hypothetical protein [bacterium]
MKKALLTTLICLVLGGGLSAALAFDIPNIFSSGEQISSTAVNENFAALAAEVSIQGTPITASDIPLTITSGGTYYFAEDIFNDQVGGFKILVTATGEKVTIDLNGHELDCGGVGNGFQAFNFNITHVTIKNGTIRDCAVATITGDEYAVNGAHIHDLLVINPSGVAFSLYGGGAKIEDCHVLGGDRGITQSLGDGNIIKNNIFQTSNSDYVGIDVSASVVKDNVVRGYATPISCGGPCVVVDNVEE